MQKMWIASLDRPKLGIRAQYNPKDLKIKRQVTWNEPTSVANQIGGRRPNPPSQSDLDFKGLPKRSMDIELLFDGYEQGRSVERDVAVLESLATVYNPEAVRDHERRPHHCLVGWGGGDEAMRPFCCVINSLTTTYQMWDTNGRPLRASCSVSLTEAHYLTPWLEDPSYESDPPPYPDWYQPTVAWRTGWRDEHKINQQRDRMRARNRR